MPRPLVPVVIAALTVAAVLVPVGTAIADSGPTASPTASASATPIASPSPSPYTDPNAWWRTIYPADPNAVSPANPTRATATWVNDRLRIVYDQATYDFDQPYSDSGIAVYVDTGQVDASEDYGFKNRVVTVHREASAGPAHVIIESTGYIERGSYYDLERGWLYEATVSQQLVKPKPGQVSAGTLLAQLKTAKPSHAASYRTAGFRLGIDANHDGESTRTEVLKAESSTPVKQDRRGEVVSGTWVSAPDGRTIRSAADARIDRLVPLREAWVSGAASWSERKRTAFANDLGYGPSLAVVSKQAAAAKGSKDPAAYLPSDAAERCAYVRRWIAVKSRWGLAVDAAERSALTAELVRCASPSVAKPGKPDVSRLAGR